MSSGHREGRTINFFFHLINQTSLYCWLYFNMRWTNKIFFEGIWRWPVINIVNLIHEYPYLISLETAVGYTNLQRSRNPGQFRCVLEKPVISNRGTGNMESLGPSAELVWRPRTMLKILYFSGGYQFFKISPGIKFIFYWDRKRITYWLGRHILGPARKFHQIYRIGKPSGCISPGHLYRLSTLKHNVTVR